MKKNFYKSFLTILMSVILLLVAVVPVSANSRQISSSGDAAANDGNYTIADITGIGDITLNGSSPSYTFYLPVKQSWQITGINLQLLVSYSKVLRENSTLTIKVNNVPLDSILLEKVSSSNYSWNISIPADMITGDSVAVSLSGFLRVSDIECDDIENAANWVLVSKDSTIKYLYQIANQDFTLEQIPYPFIDKNSLKADKVVLVSPKDASGEEMVPVLQLAGYLGSQSTWRGLDLSTLQPADVSDDLKANANLIYVGTIERLTLANSGVTWPLKFGSGKILQTNGKPVADDSGVIMIAGSPWNPEKAVMAITGVTASAVTKAAQAVSNGQFQKLVRGNYAFIPTTPVDQTGVNEASDWAKTNLEALGYSDQKVNGIGDQTISIPLNFPTGLQPKEIKVTVVFNHSPFVSTDRSFLVLNMNGIPQEGVYLNEKNEKRTTWTVTIPSDQLTPGKNTLEVLFTLHMADGEYCTEDYYDQAWAVLSRQTTLEVTFDSATVTPDLSSYPSPFGKNTLVIVSPKMGAEERKNTFLMLSQLGTLLGDQAQYLKLVTTSQITDKDLAGNNLIIIGNPTSNALAAEAIKSAPVTMDANGKKLKTSLFDLTIQDGQPVGIAQDIVSPWDSSKSLLLISGTNDKSLGWATGLFTKKDSISRLSGDIAIVDEKEGLTLVDSHALEKSVSPIQSLASSNNGPSDLVIELVLIGLIVILMILLIVILAKRRYAKH